VEGHKGPFTVTSWCDVVTFRSLIAAHETYGSCGRPHAGLCRWKPARAMHARESGVRGVRAAAINVARQRSSVAALLRDRVQRRATDPFERQRGHPRTAAASPCRPRRSPSPDARSQTAWRLQSGFRQTPPSPVEAAQSVALVIKKGYLGRAGIGARTWNAPRELPLCLSTSGPIATSDQKAAFVGMLSLTAEP